MGLWRQVTRGLRVLINRRAADEAIADEVRDYFERDIADRIARGLSPEDARRAARLEFGHVDTVREEVRLYGWENVIATFLADLRYAARRLRRRPGFSAVVVLTLALGIGVNLAIFTFVDALFLSPLPGVRDSAGLVSIEYREGFGSGPFTAASYPAFESIRAANHTLDGVLAYSTWTMTVRSDGRAETVTGEIVSPNYFDVLGTTMSMGRAFVASEGQTPGGDPVAVVSYDFWHHRLGADRLALGRPVQIGTRMFTVIGVAPPDFRGLSLEWEQPPAVWVLPSMSDQAVPLLGDVLHESGNHSFTLAARLRAGSSLADARNELTRIAWRTNRDHADTQADGTYGETIPILTPAGHARFSASVRPDVLQFLGLLGAIALFIYLIACVNVASLVVTQAARRERDLALQLSLGARRGRLTRQLLTENMLLSTLGAGAGLLVARWSVAGLSWFGQAFRTPVNIDASLDVHVLAFTMGITVLCALLLTVFPARLASRASLTAVIAGANLTATRRAIRGQHALLAVQVAISVVLLVGANLFARTLQNARAVDPTHRPQEMLLAELDLAAASYDETRGAAFYGQLLERLRSEPAVRDAALVLVVPLGGRRGGADVVLERRSDLEPVQPVQVGFNIITPGHFRTIGLPIVAGRELADTDRHGAVPVAVVNEVAAGRLFHGRSPIGQRFLLQWPPPKIVEIVGVVRDGPFRTYRSKMEPTVYVPLAQWYQPRMTLEARASRTVSRLLPAIEEQIASVDNHVALTHVRTGRAHFDEALARERLIASLLGALGLLALTLAAVGLYGVLSDVVAQRTREIGIRVALGATPGGVVRLVLRRMFLPLAVGLSAGMAAAFVLAGLARGLLFGVGPADTASFAAALTALGATGALAAWLPARRAAVADPLDALRHE